MHLRFNKVNSTMGDLAFGCPCEPGYGYYSDESVKRFVPIEERFIQTTGREQSWGRTMKDGKFIRYKKISLVRLY